MNQVLEKSSVSTIPVRDNAGGFAFVPVQGSIPRRQQVVEPVHVQKVISPPPSVQETARHMAHITDDVSIVEKVNEDSQQSMPISVTVEDHPEKPAPPKQHIPQEPVTFEHLDADPLAHVPTRPSVSVDMSSALETKSEQQKGETVDAQKSSAKYYVNAEDELDVERITIPEGVESYQSRFDQAGHVLAKELKSDLKPVLLERFTRIIVSRWKDIRDDRETREVLMRDKRLGGMGFPEAAVDGLIKTINEKKESVLNHTYPKTPEIPHSAAETLLDETQSQPMKPIIKPVERPITKKSEPESEHTVSVSFMTEVKPRKGSRVKTASISHSKTELPPPVISTVGPIEELEGITMEYLRRLNKDPKKAAQKVFQKVDLLGDESFELKAQGVRAWKRSPAYQMYLAIGQKSIAEKIPVEDVVNKKMCGDMTMEEFENIADLNRSLQF